MTIIYFQTGYSQNEYGKPITIIGSITNCYSDSLIKSDIPMKVDIINEYFIDIYVDGIVVESILANSNTNTNQLLKIKTDKFRLTITPLLSKTQFDTTINVINDTVSIIKCIGEIFSEKEIGDPKLEATNDIKNGNVQLKWLVENSNQDHSLKKMNKVSRKYNFEVICIGHHWTSESIQYINSYNSVVFLYLNEKYGKKTIERVAKKLMNKD